MCFWCRWKVVCGCFGCLREVPGVVRDDLIIGGIGVINDAVRYLRDVDENMFINIQWIECKQIQFINVNLYINDFQCEISWKTCYDQNYRFEWCCLGYRFFCVRKQKVSTEIFKEKQTEKRRSWKMRPSRDSRVVVCWTKSEKKSINRTEIDSHSGRV